MTKLYDPLYKFDTKKKLRVWRMEQDGPNHRTIAGLADGKLVESGWTLCETTNAGRSNERDPVTQAVFEIEAQYEHQLTRDYHRTPEGARGGAHFFEPMLADKYNEKKFQPGYAQPKLDGFRCIVKRDGMWSREGKPFVSSPHIFDALLPILNEFPDAVFDGELYNHALREDFDEISSLVRTQKVSTEDFERTRKLVQYHVYDFPSCSGKFSQRMLEVTKLISNLNPVVQHVQTQAVSTVEVYDKWHWKWMGQGYEGSVWRADAAYENRRTKSLRKRKEWIDGEFEVIRIEAGLGNWAGAAKRVVCRLPDGREFKAGIKGSRERARVLLYEDHKIVTIEYCPQLTPDGIPRFGRATKWHGDKREF